MVWEARKSDLQISREAQDRERAVFFPMVPGRHALKNLIACFDEVAIVTADAPPPLAQDIDRLFGGHPATQAWWQDHQPTSLVEAALDITREWAGEDVVDPLVEQNLLRCLVVTTIPAGLDDRFRQMRTTLQLSEDDFLGRVLSGIVEATVVGSRFDGVDPQDGLRNVPATDFSALASIATSLMEQAESRSVGEIILADVDAVGVDLADVPLDEILSYRSENLVFLRRYRRSVREWARSIQMLDHHSRLDASRDRLEEVRDRASDVRRRSETQWKRPARIILTAATAMIAAIDAFGDPSLKTAARAAVATGTMLLGLGEKTDDYGPMSYIMRLPSGDSGATPEIPAHEAAWRAHILGELKKRIGARSSAK